jgi:hypothetical protein
MSWEKEKVSSSRLGPPERVRVKRELAGGRNWTGWLACPAPFFVEPSSPHRSHQPAMQSSDTHMGGAMVLPVHSEGTGVLVLQFGLAPRALLTRRLDLFLSGASSNGLPSP